MDSHNEQDNTSDTPEPSEKGLYILLLSVHGLIRGRNLELGRDADTGGQIRYVVDLAKALGRHPQVSRVDLVTRLIDDKKVDASYREPVEELNDKASIVRIVCPPNRYFRKEALWHYMDRFADNVIKYLRRLEYQPDLVHGHYADAGYVGTILAGILNIPLVFTGHSLGREKKRRLQEKGLSVSTMEKRYRISRRIEAEESTMDHASLVIASTEQEVTGQYKLYDNYHPQRKVVIPPGIDIHYFCPENKSDTDLSLIRNTLSPFLTDLDKPAVLAICRPDPKKNLHTLLHSFGTNEQLKEKANLVIVAGNRDDIKKMEAAAQKELKEILYLIDRYDLYGKVAIPKHHTAGELPDFYRYAASVGGVFINPALVEPFGLTILEASACGLPVVATKNGGPGEILEKCSNGVLVDPMNPDEIADALLGILSDPDDWKKKVEQGIHSVRKYYSWKAHVDHYLNVAGTIITDPHTEMTFTNKIRRKTRNKLTTMDRILITDIDGTLIGEEKALRRLLKLLDSGGRHVGFGVASGRSLELVLKVLKEWDIPIPDLLITSVGSEIYYGPKLRMDGGWQHHINYRWNAHKIKELLNGIEGLELQPPDVQRPHKISYFLDKEKGLSEEEIVSYIRKHEMHAKVIFSHGSLLDILPIRASKGLAVRYFSMKWELPLERVLVAGDSGNDGEMLTGNSMGVVVGNYSEELEAIKGMDKVYFAEEAYAAGIIEGMEFYDFMGRISSVTSKLLE